MTRAERRRQAKMQEKCQVPLNLNLTVAQVAGMTGQQASILQTYLKRMEQQKTEAVTDAVIRRSSGETGAGRGLYYHNKYNHFPVCD